MADLHYFVDIVEAPGWLLEDDGIRQQSRVVLHNLDLDASLADPGAIDAGWQERAARAIAATGTPWVSLHLGFSAERVRFDHERGYMLPESPTLDRDTTLARIVDSARRAKAHLGVPLLLENLDYCPGGAYEQICEPGFIREVLEAVDCGLVLDIGHLQVTASALGVSNESMLEALPLERLVELHVSSPRPIEGRDGRLYDAHETLLDRDIGLLRSVLERASPRLVVLEYRRDAETLRDELLQVARVIQRRPRPWTC